MSAKCSPYMYGVPYIFYFVHPIVKTVEIMVQRVDFERNLKNICPDGRLSKEEFGMHITLFYSYNFNACRKIKTYVVQMKFRAFNR